MLKKIKISQAMFNETALGKIIVKDSYNLWSGIEQMTKKERADPMIYNIIKQSYHATIKVAIFISQLSIYLDHLQLSLYIYIDTLNHSKL